MEQTRRETMGFYKLQTRSSACMLYTMYMWSKPPSGNVQHALAMAAL
jgi:hypothetical protein